MLGKICTGIALVAIVFILISSVEPKSAQADPDGQDTWGLSANQNYVDLSTIVDCNSDLSFYGGDSDSDGICNHWEDGTNGNGLHVRIKNTAYTYDLSCDPNATYSTDPTGYTICPVQNHKDVYVELDWMKGHAPSTSAISDVTNAFNMSTVNNGDSKHGVHLHVQYGEDPSTSDGNTQVHVTSLRVDKTLWNTNPGFWVLKENRFGTIAERNTNDANHNTFCSSGESWHDCGSAKRQVFHYAVYIHKQYGTTSSGWSEIGGNDFAMSLASLPSPGVDEQEASFMHELGHNLGLYHGGAVPPDVNGNGYDATDDAADNCKPNYFSIMSYTYEFRSTADQCRPLDYSRWGANSLPENSLSDDKGVTSNPYPNPDPDPPGAASGTCNNVAHNGMERPFFFSNPPGTVSQGTTGSSQVDWNGDGIHSGVTYPTPLNINKFSISGCTSIYNSTLTRSNDWTGGIMNYNFRTSALAASGNLTIADTCDNCPQSFAEYVSPDTFIDTVPHDPSNSTASFTFYSDQANSTFVCQLDNGSPSTCSSPKSYSNLQDGAHTFSVKAIVNGLEDPSPASHNWNVSTLDPILIGAIVALAAGGGGTAYAIIKKKRK